MKLGDWIGLFGILASLYILWSIRFIALLLFMAVVVAIALNSFVRRLQQAGMPRRAAIPIVLTVTFLLVTLFFLGVVPPFVEQFSRLIDLLLQGLQDLPDGLAFLEEQLNRLPGQQLRLPRLDEFFNWLTSAESGLLEIFNNFFLFFNSSVRIVLQTLLVLILSLMLLGNPAVYRSGLLRLLPAFYRQRADAILQDCEVALCHWLGGICLNSLFIFSISFVGLWVLGIRLVLAHALIAGLLNFIPNIGPGLSVVFPVTVALLSPDPWKAIPVIVLYVVIQQVESYWLTPAVMARQVSLPPAVTLVAQIFFASVFGFLGLLLALPLAVVVKIWVQELLIEDILDRWDMPRFPRRTAALSSEAADSVLEPVSHSPEQVSS